MKKINSILQDVLEDIVPDEEEMKKMEIVINSFTEKLRKKIGSLKIDAEVFLGGSFAKKTVIKKDNYDVDLFVRFDKKYGKKIPELIEKILDGLHATKIHGSRDYFRIKLKDDLFLEVIPVLKIKKATEMENITDLSFMHVRYIERKIKKQQILDDIKLAKAFCYANKCYGAESYIQGFSGYALELLVYYYGSFEKFLREITKSKNQIIIDIEKDYKNRKEILLDLNEAKLKSPIILIDPTYKQRNALAALSEETFEKFKKSAEEFLKSPSIKSFEIEKTDLEKIRENAKKKNFEFVLLEAKTGKQEGDIAGSKLLKFYKHLEEEVSRFFEIKEKGFNYNGKKSARYFFVVDKKREIVFEGPFLKDSENVKAFEKIHKDYYTKDGKIYAKGKVDFSLRDFIAKWKKKYSKKIKEMSMKELGVVE